MFGGTASTAVAVSLLTINVCSRYYSIVAFDQAQNHSSPSSATNVLTSSDSTAPATPESMAIAYTSPTSVSMTWTASTDSGGSGLQGYRVYRDGALISQLAPSAPRIFVDTSLAANAAYTYTVTAVDNVGNESAGIHRSVFRDDFNRSAGTGLNSPYWTVSGNWVISSNSAFLSKNVTSGYEAHANKSVGSFNASVKTLPRANVGENLNNTQTSSGMVFWSNDAGTERYLVNPSYYGTTLQYVTPGETLTVATSSFSVTPPYLLAVEADATTRAIEVWINGISRITYTETDTGRRNSGRVGLRGYPGAPQTIWDIKTDEFKVVEKGGSLTSTDIVPANVRLTYLSGTSVQVDWDASADIGNGVAGYEVLRDSTLVSGGSLLTGTSFQNTGLTANTAYTYTVKAVDNPGTRYASAVKAVFRDDFNRTGSLTSNPGWSSAGSWSLVSNTLETSDLSRSNALTAASLGSFRATATITTTSNSLGGGIGGIVFWTNGTEGYRVEQNGLYYFNGANEEYVAWGIVTNGTLRVETNAEARTIRVYHNSTLLLSYAEGNTSRPNSGKVGITGYIGINPEYVEYCYENPECAFTVTADDFIVEEQ